MRLHRFFINTKIESGDLRVEDRELANQLKNVFRAKSGEEVIVLDGSGKQALAEIAEIKDDLVSLRVKEIRVEESETKNNVTLYCSILKKENFELVGQKATEVGVFSIVPLLSARTVKQNINFERLNKIVKEASEQSGRTIIPKIASPITFKEAVEKINKNDLNIIFDREGLPFSTWDSGSLVERIAIFIGPEGGWTDEETKLAKEKGFKIMSLGNLTLRGETAAIMATYLAVNL